RQMSFKIITHYLYNKYVIMAFIFITITKKWKSVTTKTMKREAKISTLSKAELNKFSDALFFLMNSKDYKSLFKFYNFIIKFYFSKAAIQHSIAEYLISLAEVSNSKAEVKP